MSSTITQILDSLLCFRKQPQVIEVVTTTCSLETKQSKRSSASFISLEKDARTKLEQSFPLESKLVSRYNRALAVVGKKEHAVLETYPYPILHHEKELIISTRAVGLNPIDWKSVDYNFCLPELPWITGREMAGVVEQVGSEVTKFKVGQRVWTSTYYRDCRAGCFQQYVTVPEHTVSPIPKGLSFEEASCLGVAGLTAAMALWRWLEVPGSPRIETQTISKTGFLLIWGGATITAHFATQIAALGGLTVIAVTSEKSRSTVENLGAAHVITRDGKSCEQIIAEIRAIGGDSITRGIDLVGTTTAEYCLEALSTTQRVLFAPLAMISAKSIVPQNISVKTVEMKKFVLEEGSSVYALGLNRLIEERRISLPSIEVLHGGLEVIVDGLDRMKTGDFGGKRVVVRM